MNHYIKSAKSSKQIQKDSKKKTPWWFYLNVKDLVNPIKIRRVQILSFGALLFVLVIGGIYTWENYLREPTGAELVDEIVNAAGGLDTWNGIENGQFTRTHNLYDDTGKLLKVTKETFYFKRGKEGLKLQVKSVGSDKIEVMVGKDAEGFWATKDNVSVDPREAADHKGMMCDSKFCEPDCSMSMAFFRFSMPFKLKDNGVNASIASTEFNIAELSLLESSEKEPTLLDISYDPKVGKDKWRFYIDPQDKLIHKVEYYNKSDNEEIRPEEIYWTDHKTVDGITFSHRWIRYWPNGKVMDEYVYSDVNLDDKLSDEFFIRKIPSEIALR
tara:strand:+ start:393 stop:1376 length:984 start_codon:yes stop_codon:yes gene_type:complete